MQIYNYDAKTKEFINTETAQESPLEEDVYLIPANSTKLAPPNTKENEVAIFNGVKWAVEKDYRGQTIYNTDTKEEQKVDYVGAIKDGWTLLEPFENSKWSDGKWVLDKDKLLAQKLAELSRAKDNHLAQGINYKNITFYSDKSTMLILGAMVMTKDSPRVFKGMNATLKQPSLEDISILYTLVKNNVDLSFAAEEECSEIINQSQDLQSLDVEKLFKEKFEELQND